MSKRSTTEADGPASRRRRLLPRLADVRIRSKLVLILVVPVVALMAVAGLRLADSSAEALSVNDTASMVELTDVTVELIVALQDERREAAIQLNAGHLDLDDDLLDIARFETARDRTVVASDAFDVAHDEQFGVEPELDFILEQAVEPLSGLERVREKVADEEMTPGDLNSYGAMITRLQAVLQYAVDVSDDPDLTRYLRTASLLTEADEASERMLLIILSLADGDPLDMSYRDFVLLTVERDRALSEYERTGVRRLDDQYSLYDVDGLGAAEGRPANSFESAVHNDDAESALAIDHDVLLTAYNSRHVASGEFVSIAQNRAVSEAQGIREAVVRQVLIEIAVVLITLVLAVVTALVIARSMASSLRRLREGAQETARVDLPQAVTDVRDPAVRGNRSAEEIAGQIQDPLRMYQRDEVGAVARSFNEIHREAVKIAVEQAALRDSVALMYVNLARRSQSLVDRLIGHLDRLERGEEDPDRLAELFQLDHLATRMRRHDENLLVLAGADSARVEHQPAHIGDVLRAAQSEVEHYTRVEFGTVLADSEVQPEAVNDVVHLIAELLENATVFSPPDSAVVAEARQVGADIHVRITDRGIGMSPQQLEDLNMQLRTRGAEDLSASRMMGLVVVARLALRHGLTVNLQEGPGGKGTIAEVVLTQNILTAPGARSARPTPYPVGEDPVPAPEGGMDGPGGGLFEPIDVPANDAVPPFTPATHASDNGRGIGLGPGDAEALREFPYRNSREVTGEIVSAEETEAGPAGIPAIRLDAASAAQEPPRRASSDEFPPAWPAPSSNSRTTEPSLPTVPEGALDETMELPIFREVESAWFKTSTPAPRPAGASSSTPAADDRWEGMMGKDEEAQSASGKRAKPRPRPGPAEAEPAPYGAERSDSGAHEPGPGGLPQRRSQEAEAEPADSEFAAPSWATPADEGWQVAADTASREVEDATEAGLPKRKPMERLVPGSVQESEQNPSAAKLRRNPEGVRGLLSAYHRGVQRGRHGDTSSTTNLRSGKERDE